MKYCLNCGHEVSQNDKRCPYCGKELQVNTYESTIVNQSSNVNIDKKNEHDNKFAIRVLTTILGVVFVIPGLILLIVYISKEIAFHNDYDLSDLTELGINVAREATGNDLNVTLIIVGVILFLIGIGLIFFRAYFLNNEN